MQSTIQLDDELIKELNNLSIKLNKKRNSIIKEALKLYTKEIQKSNNILNAVKKVKEADLKENIALEDTINDGL